MNDFRYREDLNEIQELPDGKVKVSVFAEGWDLECLFENEWHKPNIEKSGVNGFSFTTQKKDDNKYWFRISQLGLLSEGESFIPAIEPIKPVADVPQLPVDNDRLSKFLRYSQGGESNDVRERYKSFVRTIPDGDLIVPIDYPSNCISYHRRGEQGTLISSTVSVYDEGGRLLIQSSNEGVIEGNDPYGNNHRYKFFFPLGRFRCVISNDGNNGKGDESWIEALVARCDKFNNGYYFDEGMGSFHIEKGQSKEFWFDTRDVKIGESGFVKINNVSR